MDHINIILGIALFLVVILLVIGFLLKGERFSMVQDTTGKVVHVKRGFSFTYFFFGPLVPLARGHIGGFFLTLFVEIFSLGIARLVLLFCYNGMYINWLANSGFHREANEMQGYRDNRKEEFQKCDVVIDPVNGIKSIEQNNNDVTVGWTNGKIEVLSGVFQGAEIELQFGDSILIGRDETCCSLIIDGKEISRRHCEISYEAGQRCYYVTDYSTNGVYLDNGQKLEKESCTALPPGASLRLGTTQNVFLLK